MSTDPTSYLPLTEPTFYILLSLAPGKKHGYAIMKDVKELSKSRVKLLNFALLKERITIPIWHERRKHT